MGRPAQGGPLSHSEASRQGHAGLAEKGNKSSKHLWTQVRGSTQVGTCLDCITIQNKRPAKKQQDRHLATSCRATSKHFHIHVSSAHLRHVISSAWYIYLSVSQLSVSGDKLKGLKQARGRRLAYHGEDPGFHPWHHKKGPTPRFEFRLGVLQALCLCQVLPPL